MSVHRRKRSRCLLPRSIKNPKAFCRWFRMNWEKRVRMVEKELGGEVDAC